MTTTALGPVTVAIVIHDDGGTIGAVLDGIQTLGNAVAEVLVIDNASTDDGPQIAERHAVAPRVVRRGVNDGPCPARNVGLEQASTRWVLAVDGDVEIDRAAFDALAAEAQGEGVAVVMPRAVLARDENVVHYDGGSQHYVGLMCLPNLLATLPAAVHGAHDVDAVVSMALLVDRAVLLDAGGWDEAFFILFEDHDVSYRLRARGHRLRFVPSAIVRHHDGTAGISFRPGATAYPRRRAFLHGRNRSYLIFKNYSVRAWLVSLPGRALYDLAYLTFALRRGLAGPWLAGRLAALRMLPRAMGWRRRLAGHRVVPDGQLLGADDLTFSPVITPGAVEARLEGLLNGLLAGWWRLAAFLLPGRRPAGPGASNGESR